MSAGQKNGQKASDCRDRRRAAWRSNCYGGSLDGYGMYCLYGQGGYHSSGFECLQNGTVRCQGSSRNQWYHDLKGCGQ